MSQPLIYLDAMVSSPHFPKQEGSLAATSKVILPNLKRTGIRSKYSKAWRAPAVDITGRITNKYLLESSQELKILSKSNSDTAFADSSFNMPHRIQLNKVLIKLDKKREMHLMKTRSKFMENTKSYGFDTIHSSSLCPSPDEISNLSRQLHSSMQTRSERKKHVYSRMTLFESMIQEGIDTAPSSPKKNKYDVSNRASICNIQRERNASTANSSAY